MRQSVVLGASMALALSLLFVWSAEAAAPATVGRYDLWEASYAYSSAGLANAQEQVTVTATFHTPSGATLTWPGFFYDTSDYRVRFTPAEVGTYTYSVAISGGPSGVLNDSGSFTSTATSNKGFLRPSPSNPYRLMNEADGSISSLVGFNTSWGNYADSCGLLCNFIGTAQEVPNNQFFQTFGQAGFNVFRLFSGLAGLPYVASYGAPYPGGPGNTYNTALDAKLLDQVYANAHANGYHIQVGLLMPTSGAAYPGTVPGGGATTKETNAVKYAVARYGGWADIWEMYNEQVTGPGVDVWLTYLRNYIHSIDPYNRMVTNSFAQPNDVNYLDFRQDHTSLGQQPKDQFNFLTNNHTTGKPGGIGETYDYTNACDPAGHRLHDWGSFMQGMVDVYWSENWVQCPNTTINVFLGSTERAYTAVLAGVANTGFDSTTVASAPASTFNPGMNGQGVSALSSSNKVLIYAASNAGDTTSYTTNVTFNFPFAGTGSWIDPKTGNVVGTRAVTAGSQAITSPSFKEDIAFVVSNGGAPLPTPTPTPPPPATSTPTVVPGATNTPTPIPTPTATAPVEQTCTSIYVLDGVTTVYTRPMVDCADQ